MLAGQVGGMRASSESSIIFSAGGGGDAAGIVIDGIVLWSGGGKGGRWYLKWWQWQPGLMSSIVSHYATHEHMNT